MQHNFFKRSMMAFSGLLLVCITAFTAKAGLDSYEIYLNNKLILKQYVNQPLTLSSLQLTQKNAEDRLIIHYSQCNVPSRIGKNRSITVKDASGKTIKQWRFADATSSEAAMVIAVKDLLQLEKSNGGKELSLVYTAEGRNEGQMLANFHLGQKSTAHRKFGSGEAAVSLKPSFSFIQPLCL